MTERRRVVITGLGAISPVGMSAEESWQAVLAGKSGVGRITRFDCEPFAAHIAAEVKGFDPSNIIESKEIKKLDLFSQYAIVASDEAWKHSGLDRANVPAERIGCILGVGIGGLFQIEKYHELLLNHGPRKISPFFIPGMVSNLGPGNVAIHLGLKGVNYTVTSACTSATHAIGESYRMIRDGLQDVVVTGGSEAAVVKLGIGGFCALKALSLRNDDPERASRPFDKDRDGFVLGEGAAVLVLEDLEHAKARGATVFAEVVGYGFSCDAYHITAPSPNGEGAIACMRMAIQDAGLALEDIQYINAHGTSTDANDITETKAIIQVFGEELAHKLMVSSTKSMTGHLLGAAGGIEALFTSLTLRDQMVAPTINLDEPGEGCTLDYVPNEKRAAAIEFALSNSFGFGGTNATIALKRYTA
ncbi:MAG: beta-ketoacyl-ACP synthase II [Bdellovibrionales bacterium]|nr:beta-ketoacyl-ACP synthase II [Bdellovibrionales bacterium]